MTSSPRPLLRLDFCVLWLASSNHDYTTTPDALRGVLLCPHTICRTSSIQQLLPKSSNNANAKTRAEREKRESAYKGGALVLRQTRHSGRTERREGKGRLLRKGREGGRGKQSRASLLSPSIPPLLPLFPTVEAFLPPSLLPPLRPNATHTHTLLYCSWWTRRDYSQPLKLWEQRDTKCGMWRMSDSSRFLKDLSLLSQYFPSTFTKMYWQYDTSPLPRMY